MKTSMQLNALVRNLAKEKSVGAEIILRNYMLERLLERISLSVYRNSFILKGGMLIAAMVGMDTRTTMDLDATIRRAEEVLGEGAEGKIIEFERLLLQYGDVKEATVEDMEDKRERRMMWTNRFILRPSR